MHIQHLSLSQWGSVAVSYINVTISRSVTLVITSELLTGCTAPLCVTLIQHLLHDGCLLYVLLVSEHCVVTNFPQTDLHFYQIQK